MNKQQHYDYFCVSRGTTFKGGGTTSQELTSSDLTRTILLACAEQSVSHKVPWDPFNALLAVRKHHDNNN